MLYTAAVCLYLDGQQLDLTITVACENELLVNQKVCQFLGDTIPQDMGWTCQVYIIRETPEPVIMHDDSLFDAIREYRIAQGSAAVEIPTPSQDLIIF